MKIQPSKTNRTFDLPLPSTSRGGLMVLICKCFLWNNIYKVHALMNLPEIWQFKKAELAMYGVESNQGDTKKFI